MNAFNRTLGAVAAVMAFGLLAAPTQAAVVNGAFEDVSSSDPGVGLVNGRRLDQLAGGPGASWDVFRSIPGWTTTAGSGIEVQTNRTLSSIDAHSGSHYVELDSHPSPNSNSTMMQVVNLSAGRYQLDFFYSPRNGDVGSNGIDYSIIGQATNTLLAGGVTGPSAANGTQVGLWTLISSTFVVGANDSPVALSFSATGAANTLGGFIDDVSISAVPVPAALPLFLTALAGLGFVSRRRSREA